MRGFDEVAEPLLTKKVEREIIDLIAESMTLRTAVASILSEFGSRVAVGETVVSATKDAVRNIQVALILTIMVGMELGKEEEVRK